MVVYLTPGYPFCWVVGEALVDEVSGVIADVDAFEIWTSVFDLLQDFHVTHSHERVFAVEELIVDDTD